MDYLLEGSESDMREIAMSNVKRRVYEVCFEGCSPYSSLVEGYYAMDSIIYNTKDERVSEEEILIRDLGFEK